MCNTRVLSFAGVLSLCCCLGLAQAEEPSTINCGTIKVGQERNIEIVIKNESKERMCIESVLGCCGNRNATISDMELDPGKTAKLVQLVKRKLPGPFKITTGVQLKGPEKRRIQYAIVGNARQPVRVVVGWGGMPLQNVDCAQKEVRLPAAHHEGPTLSMHLSSRVEEFDLRNALAGVTSKYFHLEPDSAEEAPLPPGVDAEKDTSMAVPQRTGARTGEGQGGIVYTLQCRLAAKGPLPVGELTDTMVVSFTDGSACYIPLVFRTVGNIFTDTSTVGFGKIAPTGPVAETVQLHFTHGARPWATVRWKAEGKLADAISVTVVPTEVTDEGTRLLRISLDGERIPGGIKGFLSCRLELCDDTGQTKVPLLVYGYL